MKTKIRYGNIPRLVTILLFFLFAFTILAVLLSGARIYQNTVQKGSDRFAIRTTVQYFTTRIRQADKLDHISLGQFGDSDALILTEQINGESWQTIIYCQDGWLQELLCQDSSELPPNAGEKVLQLQGLKLNQEDKGIQVLAVLPSGQPIGFFLMIRSSQEVIP